MAPYESIPTYFQPIKTFLLPIYGVKGLVLDKVIAICLIQKSSICIYKRYKGSFSSLFDLIDDSNFGCMHN